MYQDVSGLGKELDAPAASTGFETVDRWRKSITTHLHWCAASTPSGDGSIMVANWKSFPNHIINIHEGHCHEHPACQNEPGDDKEWFHPGTEVYTKLADIIESRYLVKDTGQLHQTSSLEAFHSLEISFAPKHTAFSCAGMRSRLCLAALHYNENADKVQQVDEAGNPKFSTIFPKAKKGAYSLQKSCEHATYKRLLDHLLTEYARNPAASESSLYDFVQHVPHPLSTGFCAPNKDEAIQQRLTRSAG